MVPRLAILPIWVAAGTAMVSGGGDGLILMIGLILAYAAAVTSFGLAIATWVSRLGRVIVINVLTYVLIAVGWPLMLRVLPILPTYFTPTGRLEREWEGLSLASPFFGISETTERASRLSFASTYYPEWNPHWPLFWIGVYSAVAMLLLFATLRSFDRCMGRNA
jgi:ABC-type transport system involved in multi-copper enzyme maturation permease subunit